MKTIITIMASITMLSGNFLFSSDIANYGSDKAVFTKAHSLTSNLDKNYLDAGLAKMRLSSNQVVDWVLVGSDGSKFVVKEQSELSQVLPADDYTVHAVLRGMPVQKAIKLNVGQTVEHKVNIPVGQVKLIAIKDNQPFFRPVLWKIYRLSRHQRQQVGKYHFHSQLISMPPGQYEAVIEHEGRLRKRRFWIQANTMNSVLLAMD